MSNLTTISVDVNTQLEETINGQTVKYFHSSKNKELPKVVSFQVPSEIPNKTLADGSFVIAGESFNLRTNDFENYPPELSKLIFQTCKSIADDLRK